MAKPTRYSPEVAAEYRSYWGNTTYADIWEQNALLYPHREALVDGRVRLTWAQANLWIDRLALGLVNLGIPRDSLIVLQLPNCAELPLLRVACEKAGILTIPALRNFRHTEMEYILRKTEPVGIVIPWHLEDRDYFRMVEDIRPGLANLRHVFVVDDDVPPGAVSIRAMTRQPIENEISRDVLRQRAHKADEVQLYLTSGSTGFPKFVEMVIGGRLHNMMTKADKYHLTPDDVMASLSPVGSGPNALPFLCGVLKGVKAVMLESFNAAQGLQLLERERVTVLTSVPAILIMLASHPDFDKYDLRRIRLVASSGAPLSYPAGVELERRFRCPVINIWGAVDVGISISPHPESSQEVRLLTTGHPEGGHIKLVDEFGKEVRRGDVGELIVGGPGCSAGYFRDPEATRQAWSNDGWIGTGDMARFDDEGNLVIVGRGKDMIIRGGQNIYPVEVENVLLHHPNIASVAVVGMPDAVLGERACAYVVLAPGQDLSFEEMVSYLKQRNMASFKIPERLEIVDRLPMLPDVEKVDKKALRQDIASRLTVDSNRPAARGGGPGSVGKAEAAR